MSAVRSSRYKALGKFGEHSRGYSYASSDFGRVSEKISSIGKEKVNNWEFCEVEVTPTVCFVLFQRILSSQALSPMHLTTFLIH